MENIKKANAQAAINQWLPLTGYTNHEIAENDMYDMLVWRMGFGNAEARTITAALTLAGAEWKE